MTDQFPPEPTMKKPEENDQQVHAAARLAGPSGRSPSSLTIFSASRNDAAAGSAGDAATPGPAAPTAGPPPSAGIGRLIRVPASALWTDNAAMAAWIAATPAVMMEAGGVDAERFDAPDGNIVLGTTKSGTPICVVCEVGPSSDEGLGVLLRIAAVQDGGVVLWLAGEASDGHIAALSWLNRSTSSRYSMVQVTGVRIDGSASAPIFTLVVRPARATDGPGTAPSDEADAEAARSRQRRLEDHLPEG